MTKNPIVLIIISVMSASSAAIFIVSCNEKTSALAISFYRLLFTTLIIIPFVVISKKTRSELRNIKKSSLILMVIIGLILAAHFALWISSLKFTSVASSVILVTAHPILVGPISHFLLKEKLCLINIIGIILSIIGVIVLVYGNYGWTNFTIDTLQGNILAILGGVAAGFYIIGGRKLRKDLSVLSYAFIVYSIGTITLLILCLILNTNITNLEIQEYGLILMMALIAGIFGHTLYNYSLEYVRASLASVALLAEPLFSTVFAFLIPWINQIPSIYTIFGGFIILSGIYLTSKNISF
jgi:drug/metabolite transporter (DMT)-like permease